MKYDMNYPELKSGYSKNTVPRSHSVGGDIICSAGLQTLIIVSINQMEPKMTSSNLFFCPQPKDIYSTLIEE